MTDRHDQNCSTLPRDERERSQLGWRPIAMVRTKPARASAQTGTPGARRRRGEPSTVVAVALSVVLTACGAASSTTTPLEPTPAGSSTPAAPAESPVPGAAQTVSRSLPSGRSYLLHDPGPSAEPRTLIVALHSALHSSTWMQEATGFSELADEKDFVVVYPSGERLVWNAGGCCGDQTTDDVGYLRSVVADVGTVTPIEPGRVFVVGLSNGGMMAYRAVCELPDVFRAAGVVAGTLLDRVDCGDTAVRVYAVHGSADRVVPLTGGIGYGGCYFPSQASIAGRVGAGSTFQSQIWSGGHEYPRWATDLLWNWLEHEPIRAFAASTHPTPAGC